jgi:hypothetical protein
MTYDEARSSIKTGDLLAWSHIGIKSFHDLKVAIVRAATRSEYSHVGMALVMGGRVWVVEAVKPCVRIFPLSRCGSFYLTPLQATWDVATHELALAHIGDEYSELDAVKAFLGASMKNTLSECAALVLALCDSAGISLGERATPDAVVLSAQKLGSPTYFIINESK